MDVIKILDANQARRRWADDLAAAEHRAEEAAKKQDRALRLARRRREALMQAHWASGVAAGIMAVLAGACIAKGIALLAVSCTLGAAVFAIAGSMLSERIKV